MKNIEMNYTYMGFSLFGKDQLQLLTLHHAKTYAAVKTNNAFLNSSDFSPFPCIITVLCGMSKVQCQTTQSCDLIADTLPQFCQT